MTPSCQDYLSNTRLGLSEVRKDVMNKEPLSSVNGYRTMEDAEMTEVFILGGLIAIGDAQRGPSR
jgi:hypothetical protein